MGIDEVRACSALVSLWFPISVYSRNVSKVARSFAARVSSWIGMQTHSRSRPAKLSKAAPEPKAACCWLQELSLRVDGLNFLPADAHYMTEWQKELPMEELVFPFGFPESEVACFPLTNASY